MHSSKPKSSLSETSTNKTTPTTPRASKLPRGGSTKSDSTSPSTLQKSRTSADRSLRSVNSKPTIERQAPKTHATPDQPRALKGPELHAQLDLVQEELKKAIERLAVVEIEKSHVLEELKDAKRLAKEANEKLQEALAAKKKAEESLEIEKFRADEIEQVGIEAAQKLEEKWQKELEGIQYQHSNDVAALVCVTQELEKVKNELVVASDAKNAALSHANDAMKIAEINAEKTEILLVEVNRLKALLDSKVESMNNEAAELVRKLDSEVNALKHELERAKVAEEKWVEMEALVEGLKTEVSNAKSRELNTSMLVDEWKKKVRSLEDQLEEANQAQKSSSDSLTSAMKQMEDINTSSQQAQSEISALKEKIECLEVEVARKKADLEESDHCLGTARQEALEMGREVEVLKSELQAMEVAKMQALNNENSAISNIESLAEERNKLMTELKVARDEAEKVKKAMEDLNSALHEVSMEAKETQERLLTKQAETDDARAEIEELKSALKNTQENYEVMLDEAKYEIVCLRKAAERIETEAKDSKDAWDAKELNFLSAIKKSEGEIATLKIEMGKVVDSLKGVKEESNAEKNEEVQAVNKLTQAEIEASMTNETMEQVKSESWRLKQGLLDKENELQSIRQENDDLRIREAAALEKIKELSTMLDEVKAKKTKEYGKLSPKAIDCHQESAEESEIEKAKLEGPFGKLLESHREVPMSNVENMNGNRIDEEPVEVEIKDLSSERDHEAESVDNEQDSKVDNESFEQINRPPSDNLDNGSVSPSRQKKKKPLLGKFGSLLKKKSNQK